MSQFPLPLLPTATYHERLTPTDTGVAAGKTGQDPGDAHGLPTAHPYKVALISQMKNDS